MNLSRQATVAATPERAESALSDRFAAVTSLSAPEDSSHRVAGQQMPDAGDLQESASLKVSEPPAVFFRSTSPTTVQSTAPVTPQTSSSDTIHADPVHSPTSPARESSMATPQVPDDLDATNDATWPPPCPRLGGSPLRWSDLTDDSDEEDSDDRSFSWHPQPDPATSALIRSFSGTRATGGASGHVLTSSLSPSMSPEESPTPLIAQSFNRNTSPQTPPTSTASPQQIHIPISQVPAEPEHTTIGFNLPLVPVPEDSPTSGGGTTPCILEFADTQGPMDLAVWDNEGGASAVPLVPSESPRSSPLPSDVGPSMRRHGYAGALTMLYSAADASNDRSRQGGGLGCGSAVTQPRVEAVLPVDTDERVRGCCAGLLGCCAMFVVLWLIVLPLV